MDGGATPELFPNSAPVTRLDLKNLFGEDKVTGQDIGIKNLPAKYKRLRVDRSDIELVHRRTNNIGTLTDAEAVEMLDAVGVDYVLEEIASGQLPNNVPMNLGVPVRYFRKWLERRVKPDELKVALLHGAESMVVLSLEALNTDPSGTTADERKTAAQRAAMLKAYSERLLDVARAIDSAGWSGRGGDQTQTLVPIQINVNVPEGRRIPGLEVLGAPAPAQPPHARTPQTIQTTHDPLANVPAYMRGSFDD